MHASNGTLQTPTPWNARENRTIRPFLWLTLAIWASLGGLSHAKIVINEVMASNVSFLADPQGEFDDWVELYNTGDTSVALGGMYLTDDPEVPTRWQIPQDSPGATNLRPGGYLVIWLDGETADYEPVKQTGSRVSGQPVSGFHADFRLDAGGDGIHLFDADGITLIDSLIFDEQTADVSYGRYPDGGDALRFFGEPTPWAANNEGYLGEVAPLQFSHAHGFYSAEVTRLGGNPGIDLAITTATPGVKILYTVDGTPPDATTGYRVPPGKLYTGPIHITSTVCVRAMGFKDGYKPTKIYTQTYLFDSRAAVKSLPVISLVGDDGNTFYEPNGVMAVSGGSYVDGVWTATGAGSYNNMQNRDLERPVSAEWFLPDEDDGFQVDCGLRVHGSPYMRPRYIRQSGTWGGSGKISLRLYFRSEYGPTRLEYPLFEESNAERFETIVLRAGHNDQTNPFIKDELLRRLYHDMGQVSALGTFASLFINGQYKGLYNPTEHVKEESCQEWFGSDQPWDVMTMNGIRDGESASWDAMIAYANGHNLSNAAYYAEMCKKVDVVNFIDYLIIRLWPNDWDWPQNNWSAACERSDTGQWKFFVWDAEGTFESGQLYSIRFSELNSQGNVNGYLYRALKANPNFRLLFADRLYKHFFNGGALTQQNVSRRFYEMRSELAANIANMSDYIVTGWTPSRQSIFLNAAVSEGVYTFAGPGFAVDGVSLYGGNIDTGDSLQIVSSKQGAPVYYTLDGTDPAGAGTPQPAVTTTLVSLDAAKRVLVPTGAMTADWRSLRAFDDSAWLSSSGLPGGVGFERSTGYENYISLDVGSQMYGINGSCCVRIPFQFDGNKSALESMTLNMQYDDGFVAYLNGVEVARRNFEGDPAWNSIAAASHSDIDAVLFESIDLSSFIASLRQGNNILAIQGLNAGVSSSDFLIAAELKVNQGAVPQDTIGAQPYVSPVPLTRSTRVKARTQNGSTWSALAEAVFAVGPVKENLRISEIMYHPAETGSPDDPNAEYIELTNVGSETINLNLVQFTKGVTFTFPDVALTPGGCCLVVKDRGVFEARYGSGLPVVGQYTGSLSDSGERIELVDALGTVIHSFEYRDGWFDLTDGLGFSLTVVDPAGTSAASWASRSAWRASAASGGSPGWDDFDAIPAPGSIVINELLANSSGVGPDWIELRNTTDRAVDIGGWFLSDDRDDPTKYRIGEGTAVPANGYLVLDEDKHFGNAADPGCLQPFGLSAAGETIYLRSAEQGSLTGYVEECKFGSSEPGVAFGREESPGVYASMVSVTEPTPGQANSAPIVGPIVISEILYRLDGATNVEFVELYNISDVNVTLYDPNRGAPWRFADDSKDPGIELLFPTDPPITLEPNGYLLLVKDSSLFQSRFSPPAAVPIFSWGLGRLSNAGDTIQICRPGDLDNDGTRSWIVVDRIRYSDGSHGENFPGGVDPWPTAADHNGLSLTRVLSRQSGNNPSNWQAVTPSPGTAKARSGGR
ncbi:MAG: lamin tail domain-containing protein [Solirubrobacterales bacterium]